MSLVVFANNWLGWRAVEWLVREGEEIAALVVHPPDRRKLGRELLAAANLPAGRVFDATTLDRPDTLDALRALRPRLGLSVLYDYILRPPALELFADGVYNLHPSWLPKNRGRYPNVWTLVDGTPAGVTLHRVDAGVDTGPVVARRAVDVEPVDTGVSLYRKLERAGFELLRETWPALREGRVSLEPQDPTEATTHRLRDVEALDRLDLDRPTTARELLDVLRARTFPPYRGVWFESGGRRVQVRLHLEYLDPDPVPDVPPSDRDTSSAVAENPVTVTSTVSRAGNR